MRPSQTPSTTIDLEIVACFVMFSFYFFDTENFVPIAMQSEIKSGQAKGMISETTFSDYDEVDGLYFPFSMTQGVKGMPGQPISFSKIETNPKVEDSEFNLPEKK